MPKQEGENITPRETGVELNPLQLVNWIDSRPDLYYIREAADRIQARYDSDSKEITFQSPSRRTVRSREENWRYKFKDFVFPGGRSIRGNSYASQEFDQTCTNTAGVMSLSTLWDAVSTYPIIQYGIASYLKWLSLPTALAVSALVLAASNKLGQDSCNRSKGKKLSSKFALAGFLALSAVKTLMSGVGMDILVNPTGITKGYADELARGQINSAESQLEALRRLENPKYLEFKNSCEAQKEQMKGLKTDDPLSTRLYVLAYGEYRQRLEMQKMTPEATLSKYGGSINNIPGDCNKQMIQLGLDNKAAEELSQKVATWRTEIDRMPSLQFLQKNFPDLYADNFKKDGQDIVISDGGVMVRSASTQFYNKLGDPREIWTLGFSLVWMFVSIILSVIAVFLLWSKSRLEDMKMSYSNDLLLERKKFLDGYRESLEKFQRIRREKLLGEIQTPRNGGNQK